MAVLWLLGAGCGGDAAGPTAPPDTEVREPDANRTAATPDAGDTVGTSTTAPSPSDGGTAVSRNDASSAGGSDAASDSDAGADAATPVTLPAETQAVQAIRNAFRDNAYADYPALARDIDAAAKSKPDDATVARYAAVLRLWRLTESSRDPKLGLLDLAPVLIEAQGRFDTARKLAPSDGRLVGWDAALTLRSGQALGLAGQVETGKRELADAVSTYPTFNSFVQGAALSALPRTDPDFAGAAEKMYATLELCGYKLDRDNPVLPDKPTGESVGGLVCVNNGYAPHNLEGLFLNLGDTLTKAGKPAIAKVLYQNAKAQSSFASWPYRELLEQRIADAETNAASFEDSDASNDFKVPIEAGYFCVGCHATKL